MSIDESILWSILMGCIASIFYSIYVIISNQRKMMKLLKKRIGGKNGKKE